MVHCMLHNFPSNKRVWWGVSWVSCTDGCTESHKSPDTRIRGIIPPSVCPPDTEIKKEPNVRTDGKEYISTDSVVAQRNQRSLRVFTGAGSRGSIDQLSKYLEIKGEDCETVAGTMVTTSRNVLEIETLLLKLLSGPTGPLPARCWPVLQSCRVLGGCSESGLTNRDIQPARPSWTPRHGLLAQPFPGLQPVGRESTENWYNSILFSINAWPNKQVSRTIDGSMPANDKNNNRIKPNNN